MASRTTTAAAWLVPICVAGVAHGALALLPVTFEPPPPPKIRLRVKAPPRPRPKPKTPVEKPKRVQRRPKRRRPARRVKPAAPPPARPAPPKPQPAPAPPSKPLTTTKTPAPKAPAAPRPPAPAAAPPPKKVKPAPRVSLRGYLRGLHGTLMRHRRYPAVAKRLGLEGRVLVELRVDQQGKLTKLSLYRSSGHRSLDKEALRMARAAAPYRALPAGYDRPVAVVVVPVDFKLADEDGI